MSKSKFPGISRWRLLTCDSREYFYLVSVHLPFGWNDIKSAQTKAQERERSDVWNQIDVCVTARGEVEGSFDSPVEAARGAMGQYCGIEVSDVLWESKVQARLRAHAGAAELPLKTEDALGAEIFTVVLPEDAVVTKIHGLLKKIKGVLCFSEAPGAWYLSTSKKPEELKKVHDKTVREWEAAQNEFSDEPSLPAGWLRIKSRTTGDVYFFNKSTQQSQFEMPEVPVPKKVEKEAPPSKPAPNRGPAGVESKSLKIDSLPAGWTQHISKRNGKVYYFHKATNISQYFKTCILTSGMVESQVGRLVVPPSSTLTAETFRSLLHFLYAGDDMLSTLAPHTAMYLVDAAAFYGLTNQRLKHFCELSVKDSFNEVHVLQLFEASSRLNVEGTQAVRAMALDFIISNFHTVCQQPALEQLDKSLLIEILRGVAERLQNTLQPPAHQVG
eukprot:s303_g10.t1